MSLAPENTLPAGPFVEWIKKSNLTWTQLRQAGLEDKVRNSLMNGQRNVSLVLVDFVLSNLGWPLELVYPYEGDIPEGDLFSKQRTRRPHGGSTNRLSAEQLAERGGWEGMALRAADLRAEGHTWPAIAKQVGYAFPGGAQAAVRKLHRRQRAADPGRPISVESGKPQEGPKNHG